MGARSLKVTAGHMLLTRTHHCLIATHCWALHNTQCCLPTVYTHTVYLELDGGRHADRQRGAGKERGRLVDGRDVGSKGREGGRRR